MKKSKKIGLGIAIVFIVAILSLVIWQWDNIKAIYMGMTYSEEKIESQIGKTKEKLAEKLEKEGIVDKKIIEGFSKEDEEKLKNGEMTVDEAVEKLFAPEENKEVENNSEVTSNEEKKDTSEEKKDSGSEPAKNDNKQESKEPAAETKPQTDNNPKPETKPQTDTGNNSQVNSSSDNNTNNTDSPSKILIESAVKQMYALKASYVQQLAAIEKSAKGMYNSGERTQERKLEIADAIMPQLVDAERACDSAVESILSDLKNNLSAIGADTSVVQDIREQYESEKQLQKSKYMSKYM